MTRLHNKKQSTINLSPPSLLALGFLSFILIGTLLLKLPIAHYGELSWINALFTSTSAVTITGLSVVNVGEAYTTFGKVIIMLLLYWLKTTSDGTRDHWSNQLIQSVFYH